MEELLAFLGFPLLETATETFTFLSQLCSYSSADHFTIKSNFIQ